jgi:hypothetical protein
MRDFEMEYINIRRTFNLARSITGFSGQSTILPQNSEPYLPTGYSPDLDHTSFFRSRQRIRGLVRHADSAAGPYSR